MKSLSLLHEGGLPRLKRLDGVQAVALPGLRLTPRDAAILMAVYRYRALTTPQIERLFFSHDITNKPRRRDDKPNTRCQYRLQLLYHHGYLTRDEQPQKLTEGRKPFVYWLDRKGAELVTELLDGEELDWNPREHAVSNLFLEHLLATNDVRAAITMGAHAHHFDVATWLDDRTLKRLQMTDTVMLQGPQGRTQMAAVVPDGYFVLDAGAHFYHHFLEIDLRTVTGVASKWGRRDWARKVAAYLEYYRSGKYQERYKTQGLRILTVTTGEKRLANLKAATEQAGGRARFWFTTFEQVRNRDILLDPIWHKAYEEGLHTLIW
jgi:Replication-relaxation